MATSETAQTTTAAEILVAIRALPTARARASTLLTLEISRDGRGFVAVLAGSALPLAQGEARLLDKRIEGLKMRRDKMTRHLTPHERAVPAAPILKAVRALPTARERIDMLRRMSTGTWEAKQAVRCGTLTWATGTGVRALWRAVDAASRYRPPLAEEARVKARAAIQASAVVEYVRRRDLTLAQRDDRRVSKSKDRAVEAAWAWHTRIKPLARSKRASCTYGKGGQAQKDWPYKGQYRSYPAVWHDYGAQIVYPAHGPAELLLYTSTGSLAARATLPPRGALYASEVPLGKGEWYAIAVEGDRVYSLHGPDHGIVAWQVRVGEDAFVDGETREAAEAKAKVVGRNP